MKHDLCSNMQKQMKPAPEVRTALSEKLSQPVKRRSSSWKRYGALAACATLIVGTFSVYHLYHNQEKWMLVTRNFPHDAEVQQLHSYVTAEETVGSVRESSTEVDSGGGWTPDGDWRKHQGEVPSYGLAAQKGEGREEVDSVEMYWGEDLLIRGEDIPVQEEAADAYQKLMGRFDGEYPDWYGGAYIDDTDTLMVCLVEDQDPGDKTLELQILDWTDSDNVGFTSAKYSLAYLTELMEQLNRLPDTDPECGKLITSWHIDERNNRVELTVTQADPWILAVLAQLDPEDDAILVKEVKADSPAIEDPVSHPVQPGGDTPSFNGDDAIADEPQYDDSYYSVGEFPQRDISVSTPAYDPNAQ